MEELRFDIDRARGFSALQRAENSSNLPSRRLSNTTSSFSALQRAENSSKAWVSAVVTSPMPFQCSSASRKFLKFGANRAGTWMVKRFSALQRAENSSNTTHAAGCQAPISVSVLFSEPKIPQRYSRYRFDANPDVSVLFSEPKIPQTYRRG